MSSTIDTQIDNLVQSQVANGVSSHKVRKDIISHLIEKDIDEKLNEGRMAISNGEYEEVNQKTNNKLLAELTEELLPKSL